MTFSAHRAARSFPRIQQGLRTSAEGLGQRSRGGGAGVRGILPESSPGLGTRDARASVAAGPSPLTRTAAVRGSSAGSGQVALGFVFPADSAFLPLRLPLRLPPALPRGSTPVRTRPHRLSDRGKLAPPPRVRAGGTAGRTGHVQDPAAPPRLLGLFPAPVRAGYSGRWGGHLGLRGPRRGRRSVINAPVSSSTQIFGMGLGGWISSAPFY